MSKQKKYHFIYKTTNVLTGKYYYGMHSTIKLNDGYLGSGKRLRYSIRKYGEENHKREIVEFIDSRKKLKQREKEIVNLNEIAKNDCLNLTVGGFGGFSRKQQRENAKRSNEKQKFLRENDFDWVKKKSKNQSKAGLLSYEEGRRKKIYFYDWNGKKHKEGSKQLIGQKSSIHQKGSGNSQYGTCWIYSLEKKVNKKIKVEESKKYLDKDWIKGRKMFL